MKKQRVNKHNLAEWEQDLKDTQDEAERALLSMQRVVPNAAECSAPVTDEPPHSDERRALTRIYKWADKERREAREVRDTSKALAESEKQFLRGWIVALADLMGMIEMDAPAVANEVSGRRNAGRPTSGGQGEMSDINKL